MPSTLDLPEIGEQTEAGLETDTPWTIVVYDDPVNLMVFVVLVFEKVFQMRREEAEKKMWEVHTKGRSVVWAGSLEHGELFLQQLHYHGLTANLERAEGND